MSSITEDILYISRMRLLVAVFKYLNSLGDPYEVLNDQACLHKWDEVVKTIPKPDYQMCAYKAYLLFRFECKIDEIFVKPMMDNVIRTLSVRRNYFK